MAEDGLLLQSTTRTLHHPSRTTSSEEQIGIAQAPPHHAPPSARTSAVTPQPPCLSIFSMAAANASIYQPRPPLHLQRVVSSSSLFATPLRRATTPENTAEPPWKHLQESRSQHIGAAAPSAYRIIGLTKTPNLFTAAATLAIFFFFEQPAHSFHSSSPSNAPTVRFSFTTAAPPLHRRCTATAPSRRLFRGRRCIFFFFEQPSPLFKCAVRSACTAAALPLHRRRDCSGAAASSSSPSMKFVVTGSGVLWVALQGSTTGWVF
ncbi:hypothetical protein DEO72_LG8g1462 [Vigna unguiculata]|uniref:Uncharacterized protein n=1 Tax=Vigna unguiculata TaxID=3917 RepID=A0A4D6MQV9_VIGUN|nr:hypothetical protein DEO72_LG8g1462 [Vigna unguiculata]